MTKTIDIMKEKRQVPDEVKEKRKQFAQKKKTILNALKEGPMTIPELAKATGMELHDATYHLMSLRKYGDVVTGEVDEDDEYFYYELKN